MGFHHHSRRALARTASIAAVLLAASCAAAVEVRETRADVEHVPGALPEPAQREAPQREAVRDAGREAEPLAFDTAWLGPTRPVPPGLPAAREAERLRERQAGLEVLAGHRAAMEEQNGRGSFAAALGELLGPVEAEADTAARLAALADWETAVLAAAGLGEYSLAPSIAEHLGSDVPRRRAVARRALHRMYGIWFEDAAAFAPFAQAQAEGFAQGSAVVESYRAHLGRLEQVAEQRLAELWRLDPRSIPPSLGHVSPVVRRRAATALASAVGSSSLGSEQAAGWLLERVAAEGDARALCDMLLALTDVLQGSAADSRDVARTRAELVRLARQGQPDLAHCVARALAALPWEAQDGVDPAPHAIGSGFRELAHLVATARAAAHPDADVLGGLVEAARGLAGHRSSAAGPMRRALTEELLITLEGIGARGGVGSAAAAALGELAGPEDLERLIAALEGAGDPAVRFGLLGVLARLAADVEPDGAEARRLLAVARERASDPDADLRRRALGLLSEPALAAGLRPGELDFLLERVELEPSLDLKQQALVLLRRRGGQGEFDRLLVSPAVDVLAVAGAGRLAELAETLADLAGDDEERRLAGALRLAGVSGSHGLARIARALELIAELSPAAAERLGPEAHGRVVLWAAEIYGAGGRLGSGWAEAEAFLPRFASLHLERAAAADLAPGTLELVRGLVAAERGAPRSQVLDNLAQALAAATAAGDGWLEFRVRRARARYLVGRGEHRLPLEDYRELVRLEPRAREQALATGSPAPSLEPVDLRAAAASALPEGGTPEREAAREAEVYSRRLMADPVWRAEPAAQRLMDLERWARAALALGEREGLTALAEALAGLPAEGAEVSPNAAGNNGGQQPLWAGLADRPERLAALRDLASRVSSGLAAARADDAPAQTPADEPPEDSADEPADETPQEPPDEPRPDDGPPAPAPDPHAEPSSSPERP